MLKIFKPKSEKEKLQQQYRKLMDKWHKLSKTNRAESDKAYAEAQELQDRISLID